MVHSFNGNTDFFHIVAGVLQGYTLAPFLYIFCQDYIQQMSTDLMKENGFTLKKMRRKQDLTEIINGCRFCRLSCSSHWYIWAKLFGIFFCLQT